MPERPSHAAHSILKRLGGLVRPMRTLLALCLLAFLPPASAGGVFDADVVTVEVADDRGPTCATPVAGLCLFNATGAGTWPGDREADVDQRIRSVTVTVDATTVKTAAGDAWVVPSSAKYNFSNASVPNPLFRLLTETYNSHPHEHPLDDRVWMEMDEEGVSFYYPEWYDPSQTHHYRIVYSDEGGGEYEQVGPYNDFGGSSTDQWFYDLGLFWCAEDDAECWEAWNNDEAYVWRDATPNAVFGLEYYDVEVRTEPEQEG